MPSGQSAEVVIVGGGIIGLSIAWRTRLLGAEVTLLERDTLGGATSRVAAGMLAPAAEAEFGEDGRRLLELGLRSASLWPSFAAELECAAGGEVGLRESATMLLARDADEALELERQLEFRRSLGLAVERLRPSEARRREPALAPAMRMALALEGEHSVDPRLVLAALRRACQSAGVRMREHARVEGLESERGQLVGVTLAGGERLAASAAVIAAGPWSDMLEGLPDGVPLRPVKGQIMRLRDPHGSGLLGSVIRFRGGYLVPRGDGRYVLGATVEERGFDLAPTAGGIYELLREARELLPGIAELEIEELAVGLRPGTPDNLPLIGPAGLDGAFWATGHHRNGVLLAPLTAQLVADMIAGGATAATGGGEEGGEPPAAALPAACDPARFARESRRAARREGGLPQVTA